MLIFFNIQYLLDVEKYEHIKYNKQTSYININVRTIYGTFFSCELAKGISYRILYWNYFIF